MDAAEYKMIRDVVNTISRELMNNKTTKAAFLLGQLKSDLEFKIQIHTEEEGDNYEHI